MTRFRHRARLVLAAVVLIAATATGQWFTAGVASADGSTCYAQEVSGVSGGISYHVRCVTTSSGDGNSTGGGSGSGSPPPGTCQLAENLAVQKATGLYYPLWCEGPSLCILHDPPTEAEPAELAAYDKLKPPAHVVDIFCFEPAVNGDAGGYTLAINGVQTPRQLLERADEAFGALDPPPADVRTSPDSPSVVRLSTWFWLGGNTFKQERGSSADGMLAIATPRSSSWDPGDGSGAIQCRGGGTDFAGAADSDCTHTYTRASFPPRPTTDRKGNPAYAGVVTRIYDVRYEFYGEPVTVPGARTELDVQDTFGIAVAEVQAENR